MRQELISDTECLGSVAPAHIAGALPHTLNDFLIKPTKRKSIQNVINSLQLFITAREVVERIREVYPQHVDIICSSYTFMTLTPSSLFLDKIPNLYRAHCQEIILRRIQGLCIESATDAEVIAVLCDLSKGGRLHPNYQSICRKFYQKIFREDFCNQPENPGDSLDLEDHLCFDFLRSRIGNIR